MQKITLEHLELFAFLAIPRFGISADVRKTASPATNWIELADAPHGEHEKSMQHFTTHGYRDLALDDRTRATYYINWFKIRTRSCARAPQAAQIRVSKNGKNPAASDLPPKLVK